MESLSMLLDALSNHREFLAYSVVTIAGGTTFVVQLLTIWKYKLEIEKLRAALERPKEAPILASAADLQKELALRRKRAEERRNRRGIYAMGGIALGGAAFTPPPVLIYVLVFVLVIVFGLAVVQSRLESQQDALLKALGE